MNRFHNENENDSVQDIIQNTCIDRAVWYLKMTVWTSTCAWQEMVGEFDVLHVPRSTKGNESTNIRGYWVPSSKISMRICYILPTAIPSFESAFHVLPEYALTYPYSSIIVGAMAIQSDDERILKWRNKWFFQEIHAEPMYRSGPVIPQNDHMDVFLCLTGDGGSIRWFAYTAGRSVLKEPTFLGTGYIFRLHLCHFVT